MTATEMLHALVRGTFFSVAGAVLLSWSLAPFWG